MISLLGTVLAGSLLAFIDWRTRMVPPAWLMAALIVVLPCHADAPVAGAIAGGYLAFLSGLPGGDVKAMAIIGIAAGPIPMILGSALGFTALIVADTAGIALIGAPAIPWIFPGIMAIKAVELLLSP